MNPLRRLLGFTSSYFVSFCVNGIIIFGHVHLHSRTDSRALPVEYCIVDILHNTAI